MTDIEFPLLTPEYLHKRWVEDLASREEIAREVGCSVGTVMKRVRLWRTFRRGVVKHKSWNEGLTKDSDHRLAAISRSRTGDGNPMAGKDAWNKGLTAGDDERLAQVSRKLSGRIVSAETREKMAAAKRGKTGDRSNRWTGGITKIGAYHEHRKTVDGRRIYVHRYVAELSLGRPLTPDEHVHHVDRDEANNEPINLLVLSEADHAVLHGAIYRGECDTRAEQVTWLQGRGINFLEIQ